MYHEQPKFSIRYATSTSMPNLVRRVWMMILNLNLVLVLSTNNHTSGLLPR
jgi:hypothetical protein